MSSTEEKIRAAATRNAELIKQISEYDYAPSALKHSKAYVQDLQGELQKSAKAIEVLKRKTQSELKDHEKYRDSFFRRHAHKMGGKKEAFAEKAGKEEREYFDAVLAQKNAEDNHKMLEDNLKEAKDTQLSLESAVGRHSALQKQLDELYDSIFRGMTPEFPDEDTVEGEVSNASLEFDRIQYSLTAERQALQILHNGQVSLNSAVTNMRTAMSASTWDVFGGGGYADYIERDALARAQSGISNARILVSQAQRIQPLIKNVGLQDLDQGHFWSDIVFDNIFTDMAMHKRIEEGQAALHRSAQGLVIQIREAQARTSNAKSKLVAAESNLSQMRLNLQKIRQTAFDKVLNGDVQHNDGSLPSYDEARKP